MSGRRNAQNAGIIDKPQPGGYLNLDAPPPTGGAVLLTRLTPGHVHCSTPDEIDKVHALLATTAADYPFDRIETAGRQVTGRLFLTYALTDMQPAKRVEGYDTLPTVHGIALDKTRGHPRANLSSLNPCKL